jgi:hypothetical protein
MMEMTREQLRQEVLNGGLDLQLRLAMAPWPPFSHLQVAAAAYRSAQDLREWAQQIANSPGHEFAEHRELVSALETAEEAASIAFDSALNAAYQLMWVMEECKCPRCTIGRTRLHAEEQ